MDRIDAIDEGKRSITFNIIGGEVTKYFRTYKATILLFKEGGKNMLKWSLEYEKMNDQVPEPTAQVQFLVNMAREVDAYLIN